MMLKPISVPFEPIHLEMMRARPMDRSFVDGQAAAAGGMERLAERLAEGRSIALLLGDRVLALGGVQPVLPHVGEAWMFAAQGVGRYPIALHKAACRLYDGVLDQGRVTRLQCLVPLAFPEAVRWIERLNFHREAVLKGIAPDGSDMAVYARFA